MTNLFNAIFARWTATMAARVLYNTEAKEGAGYPYSVFSLVGNNPDGTFSTDEEDCFIQFNLFSDADTVTEIGLTFTALKAAFDKFDLVIVGGTTISLMRGAANLIRVEGIWQYNVNYNIQFELD